MLLGSLVSGLAAYGFQVVGARALGDIGYAPITTLWTLQYLCFTVLLYPAETFITRERALGSAATSRWTLWAWLGGVAVVASAVTWFGRERLVGGDTVLPLVAGLIIASYGPFVVARGHLAGQRKFRSYGIITAAESVLRLILLFVALSISATAGSIAWIMPVGAALAVLLWPLLRRQYGTRPPPDALKEQGRPVVFLLLTSAATGISQLLIAAGPLVVAALGGGPAEVSVFFVTLTAARAPIVLVFGGVLSRLLPVFTRLAGSASGTLKLRRIGLALAAGTVVAAAAAAAVGWVVGPAIVSTLFGSSFDAQGWLVAGAAAGVVLVGGATVLNLILMANRAEGRMLAPWLAGLVAAIAALVLVGGSPSARVIVATDVGPLVAVAGLIFAVARQRATPEAATPTPLPPSVTSPG